MMTRTISTISIKKKSITRTKAKTTAITKKIASAARVTM